MTESKHIVIKHKASPGSGGAGRPKIVHTRPTVPPVLRKRKSRGTAMAVGIVCALVALGAGGLLLNVYKQQQREVRLEAMAVQELRSKVESLYGSLPGTIARMDGYLDQAEKRVEGVDVLAGFVTNNAASGSSGTADAAPAHHAALAGIVREIVADRDTVATLREQFMERQPTLDEKRDDVLKTQTRAVAAAAVAEIEVQLNAIDGLLAEARDVLQRMEAKEAEAGRLKEEEIRMREARAEAERLQREAEDLQRRTVSEVGKAAELVKLSKEPILRYAFGEALEPMAAALAASTTEPGRAALVLPVERLQRLQAFKTHLINGLNKSPYPWGWGMTAADSQDITGADETSVKVTRGTVEWKKVPLPQLMKIIDHLGKTERRLSSERAEDCIATAILLEELGLKDKACECVRAAIEINQIIGADARRLLPDCK